MLLIQLLTPEPARDRFAVPLRAALADRGVVADLSWDHPPAGVDYVIYCPGGAAVDFADYPRARAVFSLWAGVETIVTDPTLIQPLARLVDPGLTQGMVEWVTGHVLRHHLGLDADILGQNGLWSPRPCPPATERPVTILGLGELGRAAARALSGLGFAVTGWSRSPRDEPGLVRCLSGADGLEQALTGAAILILLLPSTPRTDNILNAARLALLPQGAVVLNPGRGALIDDAALLAALDSGHLGWATLDVFRTEPLPPQNRFWTHPRVTVTPHIASATSPGSAARTIAANLARAEAGLPILHLVDRALGY